MRGDKLHTAFPFAPSRALLRNTLPGSGQPDAAGFAGAGAVQGGAIACRHTPSRDIALQCTAGQRMKRMGIEALYRKPNTSKPAPGHKIYPYLLRKLPVTRPNQVWAITAR